MVLGTVIELPGNEDKNTARNAKLLEDFSLEFLVWRSDARGQDDLKQQSNTAETESMNLSCSDSWTSLETSKNHGAALGLLLSNSYDDDDECKIWYANSPSTCGGEDGRENVSLLPESVFFPSSERQYSCGQHEEGQNFGFGFLWRSLTESTTSILRRRMFSAEKSVPPVIQEERIQIRIG